MKILLKIIFVINCLPSTTFYQVYLFPQQIPVISLFFCRKNLKSPGFENFRLTGLSQWLGPIDNILNFLHALD